MKWFCNFYVWLYNAIIEITFFIRQLILKFEGFKNRVQQVNGNSILSKIQGCL